MHIIEGNGRTVRTHMLRGPECQLVMKNGLGVNSWALAALYKRLGVRPRAIITSDPGFEWPESWDYLHRIGAPWLEANGFPPVTVVSRASEGVWRAREVRKTETLIEECERIGYPPSAAFGHKKCSMVYKAEPSFWWLQRQPWARLEHGMRRRIAVAIGYDFGERLRWEGKDEFTSNTTEREWCYPVYPLVDARLTYEDCEALCLEEFGEVPPGSACMFCPFNTLDDWYRFAHRHPEQYLRVVSLSRKTDRHVETDGVGFLRRAMPAGKRRLHVWHDGGYPDGPPPPDPGFAPTRLPGPVERDELPCECSL